MEFQELLKRGKKDPESIDFKELRMAFIDSDEYIPYADQGFSEKLYELYQKEDWAEAEKIIREMLEINYMNLETHQNASLVYDKSGNQESKKYHAKWAVGLLTALFESGDGMSEETAYWIIDIREEYIITAVFQHQFKLPNKERSSFHKEDGQIYDIWTLSDEEGNNRMDIYFDASIPTNRFSEIMVQGLSTNESNE